MAPLRPLTLRFAKLYACVPLGVVGFCLAMLSGLANLQTLSEQAAHGRAQQAALTAVLARNAVLTELAEQSPTESSAMRLLAPNLLRASVEELKALAAAVRGPEPEGGGDPSIRQLGSATEALAARLSGDAADVPSEDLLQTLAEIKTLATGLEASSRQRTVARSAKMERRVRILRWTLLAAFGAAMAFMIAALASLKQRVVEPLKSLRHSAERFGRGELAYRIRMNRSDEIGDFAATLNQMADRLSDSQEDLEARVRERTREFLRAARMAHLGVLASGIAHEINTPLASIRSCAEGMQRRMKQGEFSQDLFRDYADTICREVERSRGITGRMLALAREEPTTSTVTSLSMVLEQVFSALAHRAERRSVRLVRDLPDEEINLRVDGGELVQIIVNLVANAIDASPLDAAVTLRAEVNPEQLILTVKDEGAGIPADQLERIFEPFFTTKAPNEGTGLGLALVSNLVESHRGRVSVESIPDQGTTFRVVLPLDWRRVQ